MVQYNFKQIQIVPNASDFVDIVLSRTQRKTPTVCHGGWKISRIREFYIRKVKHTATTWHEALTKIIEGFFKIDDIHPFYADLMNVLYDKDHYKLALGKLNVARSLIDKLSQDYVRLLKYGDTQYRCKQLKKAALGRMVTIMKKHDACLKYLERVRQHISRLPSIDPNMRTLILCGYPNVGKSSFMNLVTRAEVEVEPYAFTTKSLYLGHMDYKYLRWQVIDTPGILDRPLEERNTIEMQSITALAHLRAAVLYMVDLSESCGYTIEQQAALFQSIKPLFSNKPVLIVCNKSDIVPLEKLSEAQKNILHDLARDAIKLEMDDSFMEMNSNECVLEMSTATQEGVMKVKEVACERLLSQRVEMKVKGKRMENVQNRVYVAFPKIETRQNRICIPKSVLEARSKNLDIEMRKITERDNQELNGGAGVYSADLRKHFDLENDEWKYDMIPEIYHGHNIADFIDPDIEEKVKALLLEEAENEVKEKKMPPIDIGEPLSKEEMLLLQDIRKKRRLRRAESIMKKSTRDSRPILPRKQDVNRSLSEMKKKLEDLGMDPSKAVEQIRGRSRTRKIGTSGDEMDIDKKGSLISRKSSRSQSMIHKRGHSLSERRAHSIKPCDIDKAFKMADKARWKRNKEGRKGEGDRHIPDLRPKHLLTGKRGIGKTDRR